MSHADTAVPTHPTPERGRGAPLHFVDRAVQAGRVSGQPSGVAKSTGTALSRPAALMILVNASNPGLNMRERCGFRDCAAANTWILSQTRVADQNPLARNAFFSSRGGRVGALWTMFVDQRKACRRRRLNPGFGGR
jgi:hypothetical protein